MGKLREEYEKKEKGFFLTKLYSKQKREERLYIKNLIELKYYCGT
jgi:hypothetical protein